MKEEDKVNYNTGKTTLYKEFVLKSKRGKLKVKSNELSNSQKVFDYAFKLFKEDIDVRERLISLYLNKRNQVIGHQVLSLVGVGGTIVCKKYIFSSALQSLCSGMILLHNHPSGNTKPSIADINFTKDIVTISKLHDIELLDHIIVTPEKNYYSFADEDML